MWGKEDSFFSHSLKLYSQPGLSRWGKMADHYFENEIYFQRDLFCFFFFLVILLSGFWGWRWTKHRGLHNLKTKQMNRNNQTTTVRVDPACLILLCGSNLGGKSHNVKNPFLQKCVTLSVKMSGFLQQQIFCKVLIVKLLMVILPELRNLCSNPVHHLWK